MFFENGHEPGNQMLIGKLYPAKGEAQAALRDFARHPSTAKHLALKLVVIILRGALDGLSAVAPVGDPDYAGLHGKIALSLTGDHRLSRSTASSHFTPLCRSSANSFVKVMPRSCMHVDGLSRTVAF